MSSENEYNFNTNQIGPRIPEGIKGLILESSSWVRDTDQVVDAKRKFKIILLLMLAWIIILIFYSP